MQLLAVMAKFNLQAGVIAWFTVPDQAVVGSVCVRVAALAVWFLIEVAGVRRAIDNARDRAGVLLDDAKALVIADET